MNTNKLQLLILIFGIFAFAGCASYNNPAVTGDPGTTIDGRVENLFGYLIGVHPGKWPDKPDKNIRLKQCADIMRSAVDTNFLAMLANKLTNEPAVFQFTNQLNNGTEIVTLVTNTDIVFHFEDFSRRLTSDLDEHASLLTNPKLKTFTCDFGEVAEIVNPKNKNEWFEFDFDFSGPKGRYDGPVRQLLDRGIYTNSVGTRSFDYYEFYENGRLKSFRVLTPEHKDTAAFGENGQLQHLDWLVNNVFAIYLDFDELGNPHVRPVTLGKHPPLKFQ
jgi:hypothetical protein